MAWEQESWFALAVVFCRIGIPTRQPTVEVWKVARRLREVASYKEAEGVTSTNESVTHAVVRGVLAVPPQDNTASLVVGLAQIRETGHRVEVTIRPALLQLPDDEETAVTDPIQVQGWLTKAAEQVYFQGQIRGVVTTPCSRCLDVVRLTFEAETRVVFLPPTSEDFDAEGRLRVADDLDLYIHNGITLDLQPLVREQVVLSFPVQPLCRYDCAGLCQVCGENWNREACTCQAGAGDSRFVMLRQLRFPESS